VTIIAAGAQTFRLNAPAGGQAGTPLSVTVTAVDAFGNLAIGYRGTIHWTSPDTAALLPPDYSFTAADNGVHTFTGGVTFVTAGKQGFSATATTTGGITGSAVVSVSAAAATGRLGLHLDFADDAPRTVRFDALTGTLAYRGLTIEYFRPLAPLTGVDGTATFDRTRLDLSPITGAVNGVALTGGTAKLSKLDTNDEEIAIDLGQQAPGERNVDRCAKGQ